MNTLMEIARRALAKRPISADTATGEKGDKGEKPPTSTPFSPFSPLFHPATPAENTPRPGTASPVVLIVLDSSDPAAIGGTWHADGSFSYPATPAAPPPGPTPAQVEALWLIAEADELPARFGVSGTHPAVADAAAMVASAHQSGDPETLHFAITEFEIAVRTAARGTP